MAAPLIPPIVIRDDEGNIKSIVNQDPRTVNTDNCVHNPAPGEPYQCFCVHDWSVTGKVGVFNADTGSNDEYWGNLPAPTASVSR